MTDAHRSTDLVSRLHAHADECEAVAKERAGTEGQGLHYMNTCDWSYAMAFREAADKIAELSTANAILEQTNG